MKKSIYALLLLCAASYAQDQSFYIAPGGNDAATGTPDQPWATLAGARDNLRKMEASGPLTVHLREGQYPIAEAVVFTPEDSGTADAPITYAAHPGEKPVVHGARQITGWTQEGNFWTAPVPEAVDGKWKFTALWVNGARRTPARTPNATHEAGDYPTDADFFFAAGQIPAKNAEGKEQNSATKFKFRSGDLQEWPRLKDAWVVVFHSWATSLLPVKHLDLENQVVEFTGPARWPFGQWRSDQWYYVEHLFEGLDQPGEWFLDSTAGKLYYLPMPGEDMATAEVMAPVAEQLLVLQGDAANNQFVEYLNFDGISFRHTNYVLPEQGISDSQAAFSVLATVEASGARNCTFSHCEIMHVNGYGLWFRAGCQDNRLLHCELYDLGAGGVRIGEGGDPKTPQEAALRNIVDNNYIHDGGRLFREAVGVWIGRSSYNSVSHNEIADFRYTGISVGWSWGYAESSANHNIIEYNHIHQIGKRQLNDMGGIYCLGISPGTILRNNLIHDVLSNPKLYGGWGLYTDEGSSHILLENNVVYNTHTGGFHQHYGKDNRVRNNIFAYSHTPQIIRTREEEHNSFFFERNIVYFNNGQLLGSSWKNGNFMLDNNCYWDTSGTPLDFSGRTFAEWRAQGKDTHSLNADPLFVAPEQGDFALRPDSPALALGFKPIDITQIGLYGEPEWVEKPKQVQREPFTPPAPPKPFSISEAFDTLPPGAQMPGASAIGETAEAHIRVSAETAASAPHSLKFKDAAGLDKSFNPHLVIGPNYRSGIAKAGFQIRLEPGAHFYHEWRNHHAPYNVGLSLWFDGEGNLTAGGKAIAKLPLQEWVGIDLACALGNESKGTFDLTLTLPGAESEHHTLPLMSPNFKRLDWFGFVSHKDGAAVVYLDDLSLNVEEQP